MKNIILSIALFFCATFAFAQTEGYIITETKRLPATPVKDQYSSSTCWSFSGLSFLESEMMRIGKKDIPDISEMFIVRKCYEEKAVKYVRLNGKLNFAPGGAFHDVTWVMKNFGFIPEEIYKGNEYGENGHVHGEIDAILEGYVKNVVENKNRKLSTVWLKGFNGVLDAYFGAVPQKFNYKGKDYTPATFVTDYIGLNPDDYVEITSFTHHPFYKKFAIELPDNWAWGEVYNVPLDEFAQIFEYSIDKGYTIAWAADVSEKGFAYNKGVAVVPDANITDMTDSEKAKWETLTTEEKNAQLYKLDKPGKELTITPELRQKAFDNYTTTDDHGMHIVGTATDQIGNKYYIVKNSWGADNVYKGYFYASVPFVLYKTTCIMVHKNAIPPAIKTKLGL